MIPEDLRYTEEHAWVAHEGDFYVVGITDFAQQQLGEVTYVELPELDTEVDPHDEVAVVESVKAACDVYAPVGGTVVEINDGLEDEPDLINHDPYGDGWIFKLENVSADKVRGLMNAASYAAYLEKEAG